MAFFGALNGKRVLVTGHTGFKGAWLTYWLGHLGADVAGLALEPDGKPSLFALLEIEGQIDHSNCDIRDQEGVAKVVERFRPEVVFHLAAQPLVRLSYNNPSATWATNVMGTVNVLEAVRKCEDTKACVVISSDKCYENKEQLWGYRETDPLGGHDPYSASKGATELVVASYRRSFFSATNSCNLASARAGNVIGGGDWAKDRIVVDFIQSIVNQRVLKIRSPGAIRPWQHVMEPLSGYLILAARLLSEEGESCAAPWNFGPNESSCVPVGKLAQMLINAWGSGRVELDLCQGNMHEANLLRLDCSLALDRLGWHGVWSVEKAVDKTVEWYRSWHEGGDIVRTTDNQIAEYMADAGKMGLSWSVDS